MRRLGLFFIFSLGISLFTFLPLHTQAQSQEVLVLEVEGAVTPVMADYFQRGIDTAAATSATAVIIQLDTPGGLVDTTLEIMQSFHAAPVPVIVYISPKGAQAASAGSIITMTGHAAAMAPETVIGAASPVGQDGADLEETIFRKVSEDLKATVRNLTTERGEAATQLAEEMIDDARAVTAEEALEAGLIDVIAEDLPALLQQLDGTTVLVNNEPVVLETAAASVRELPMTSIEQLLFLLISPVLLGLLLTIGVQAILIELSSPGGWVAGLIGVLCIGLALYGLGQLPVNWLGFGLMLVAFVLFFMEIKAATHGALAITGTIILIIGLLVLFNTPQTPDIIRLSIPAAMAIGLLTAMFFIFIIGKALMAQRARTSTGIEGLIGQHGSVREPMISEKLKPPYSGMVLVAGELWRAEAAEELGKGEKVEVTAVNGFTLQVKQPDE